VRCFEVYYRDLRRRFRYGQVDGSAWQAANSLMQGCPASPDELNLLLEPFHRWALAAGFGVDVGVGRVPSVSFADDVALLAGDRSEAETLIAAYLRWCELLQLKVTKLQVWSNTGRTETVIVGPHRVQTVPTFKIVGVVLGAHEAEATELHVAPRLLKALRTLQRLRSLDVPASIGCMLLRTAVLPQALYGCEVRDIAPRRLVPLASGGKAALGPKFPLRVRAWRAPEVLSGPPLGESSVQDPVLAMRERQLRWWQIAANAPGLVGNVHRYVASVGGLWQEPTAALASALRSVGWRARRNEICLRTAAWPVVSAEQSYPGMIELHPVDDFAQPGAVYTDGSVSQAGGAAAVREHAEEVRTARVAAPRSSTQCELVALALALEMRPPHVLTDSLAALHMLRGWGTWSTRRVLQSAERALVRQVVHFALQLEAPPLLEKVKAHNEPAIAAGHPKAVGNDIADSWAKRAATEPGHAEWPITLVQYWDPVILEDADGTPVWEPQSALLVAWWGRRHRSAARARPLLEQLYPRDVEIAWAPSCGVFRRPVVQGTAFVHPAPPATIKWLARARTGCLATRMRLVGHGMVQGSTLCECCGETAEDEEHLLLGCTATGSADWQASMLECWRAAAQGLSETVPDPPLPWLEDHRFLLVAALLPTSLVAACGVPAAVATRFLSLLHRGLAMAVAERFRRREQLRAEAPRAPQSSQLAADNPSSLPMPSGSSLPTERQLSVGDLRRVELARRAVAESSPPSPRPPAPLPTVPVAGEARRRWLRHRLVTLLQVDMVPCGPEEGAETIAVLELFERVTEEAFAATPGMLVAQRLAAMAKVLSNVVREETFDPPMQSVSRRRGAAWTRRPREAADVLAWRRQQEAAESRAGPVPRLRAQAAAVNAGLATWLCGHRYLVPTAVATGESGMALLILWEVDHQQSFPSEGGAGLTAALVGFTRRLLERVARDPRLEWLESADMAVPLGPGLAPTHHRRWAVRVTAPAQAEPQGWYEDFVQRWRAYLETLVCPPGSRPMSQVSQAQLARVRPAAGRPRTPLAPVADAEMASSSTAVLGPAAPVLPVAVPAPDDGPPRRPRKRRCTAQVHADAPPAPGDHQRSSSAEHDAPPAATPSRTAPAVPAPAARRRPRPREDDVDPSPAARRQRTLLGWVRPPPAAPAEDHAEPAAPRHGRAVAGPPT
jgi:ribonuclease HI